MVSSHTYEKRFSEDGEKKIFIEFLKYIDSLSDFVVYHWHHYESIKINKMIEKYNPPKKLVEKLQSNMIDLFKVVKGSVALPTYSYGLKEIAKWLDFKWRHKEVTAEESVAYFLEYIDSKTPETEKKLQMVIEYNEDDCIATRVIRDWIKTL